MILIITITITTRPRQPPPRNYNQHLTYKILVHSTLQHNPTIHPAVIHHHHPDIIHHHPVLKIVVGHHHPPHPTMDLQSPDVVDPVLPLDWCPTIIRQIVVLIHVREVEVVHVQHLVPGLQAVVRPYLLSKWVIMLVN